MDDDRTRPRKPWGKKRLFWSLSLWLLVLCGDGLGQDGDVFRRTHTWGRFPVGAWKRVRSVSEALDKAGHVTDQNTTETMSTLVKLDRESFTLKVDVAVEVSGKRFEAPPKYVVHGYLGEADGQKVVLKPPTDAQVSVGGNPIASKSRSYEVEGTDWRRVCTVHYTESSFPYLLRRHTLVTHSQSQTPKAETETEVLSVDMPYRVMDELKSTSLVRTIHRQGPQTTVTIEFHAHDVPGGVVGHSSKDTDEAGRVIRRSTLELVDYGLGGSPPRVLRSHFFNKYRRFATN